MRAPPPVEYPSALAPAWRTALALLAGAAPASLVAWGLPFLVPPGQGFLADPVAQAVVALAAGAFAAFACGWSWSRGRRADRVLRWDGQDWVLVDPAGARPDRHGDAALMLDLGPWMLVRFAGAPGAAAWLPLTLGPDADRWAALRGALWNWRAGRGEARP